MFLYWHRKSKDIDIFFSNPQYLTMLSPRLNEYAESIATDYIEASNFIKISVEDNEIDFIIAPNLSGKLPIKKKLTPDIEILIEQPEEIIAKKFFYRTESLKIRDFLDAYVVMNDINKKQSLLSILKNLLKNKTEILKTRSYYLQKIVENEGVKNILTKLSVSQQLTESIPKDFIQQITEQITSKQ